MEIRKGSIGDEDVARIYTGDDIVHPLPVQDGLVLWYDFMGRRNNDAKRGIAEDLSGNENHGELYNFAYETRSGYEGDGLRFDGVDDGVLGGSIRHKASFTLHCSVLVEYGTSTYSPLFRIMSHPDNTLGFVLGTSSVGPVTTTLWIALQGAVQVTSLYSLDTGIKYFVTCVYEEERSKILLYINDALVLEHTMEGEITDLSYVPNIGRQSNVFNRNLRGSIYSCMFYDKPLSPEEVAHNYAIEKERWNL